jgi:hypothetical protein
LDTNNAGPYPANVTDEAYEAIPSQLLPLLRADSVGCVVRTGGTLQIQFSGIDGLAYAVQVSTDLVNWTSLSTNLPYGGVFTFLDFLPPGAPRRFYRSLLLPKAQGPLPGGDVTSAVSAFGERLWPFCSSAHQL